MNTDPRAREIIGIVPAAGRATRISPLPFSKELYPIGLRHETSGLRPKVVSHYLFERMRLAGIRKVFVILREGKWDIPTYFKDGTDLLDMHLAYLIMRVPYGSPFTLDHAYPFIRGANVALGYPDILFWPDDVFARALARLARGDAEVVLALVQCDPQNTEMVEFEDGGRVRNVLRKDDPSLTYSWVAAVWTPVFTDFMHDHLAESVRSGEAMKRELQVGDVLQAAIDRGIHVDSVAFRDGGYVDIGSPESLDRLHRGELRWR